MPLAFKFGTQNLRLSHMGAGPRGACLRPRQHWAVKTARSESGTAGSALLQVRVEVSCHSPRPSPVSLFTKQTSFQDLRGLNFLCIQEAGTGAEPRANAQSFSCFLSSSDCFLLESWAHAGKSWLPSAQASERSDGIEITARLQSGAPWVCF